MCSTECCSKKCDSNIDLYNLQLCSHAFCKKCIYSYIHDNFDCKIKCPKDDCTRNISDADIRWFFSDSDVKRYEQLCLEKTSRKCLTQRCTYVYSTDNCELCFLCPECEQPNCVKCKARHYPTECGTINIVSESARDIKALEILKRKRNERLLNYDESFDLIPAKKGFDCPICYNFILPRDGVMLRCGCNYCRNCLQKTYQEKEYFNQLNCVQCNDELVQIEKRVIKGIDKIITMSAFAKKSQMYRCKTPNCEGFWFRKNKFGQSECHVCKEQNCLTCEAVHNNMTCASYQQSDEYKRFKKWKMETEARASNKCYKCHALLIKGTGCNALKCVNCNVYTCLFWGNKIGPEGCKCTTKKPCHKQCYYGCFFD